MDGTTRVDEDASHRNSSVDDTSSSTSVEKQFEGIKVPRWEKQLTIRAFAVSFVLSILFAFIVMKLNLTTGIIPSLNVSAGLLGFFFVKSWTKILDKAGILRQPFTRQENTVIQTCVVASSGIAFSETPISTFMPTPISVEVGAETDLQTNVNIESEENVPSAESMQAIKKRKRSPIWAHFDIESDDLGKPKAVCKYCKSKFSAAGRDGTSNLVRHWDACDEYKKLGLDDLALMKGKKFDQIVYRKLLAEAICRHAYSFSWVEHEGNIKLHQYLNVGVKPISRNTTMKDCMELHVDLKEKIKKVLIGLPGKICFTSDLWSACTKRGYLCITAHYIDETWKLQSKLICFRRCPLPHTGFLLSGEVTKVLLDWGIEKKVFSLTVDNASNMDTMVSTLKQGVLKDLACRGKHFHIRCCAHILNLIVKDGLKVIDKCVIKVREGIRYIDGSEARLQRFEDGVKNLKITFSGGLWLDVVTRWNSTYIMLDRALKYRVALDYYFSGMEGGSDYTLSSLEWGKVAKICNLLEPFYEVTNLFSGSEYPTSNLYFRQVWKIHTSLLNATICGDLDIATPAVEMLTKFNKYWSEYVYVLAFGAILDPRYKMQFVKYALCKVHGKIEGERISDEVQLEFEELFKKYTSISVGDSSREEIVSNEPSKYDDLEEFASLQDADSSEIDTYLSEKTKNVHVELDVLGYWKDNSSNFPALSTMARDILAIPITSVASESTFSMGGRILSKWRSSLAPQHVEALVTTKQWLNGYNDYSQEGVSLISNDDISIGDETMEYD